MVKLFTESEIAELCRNAAYQSPPSTQNIFTQKFVLGQAYSLNHAHESRTSVFDRVLSGEK